MVEFALPLRISVIPVLCPHFARSSSHARIARHPHRRRPAVVRPRATPPEHRPVTYGWNSTLLR